jgi:hypothetical protein
MMKYGHCTACNICGLAVCPIRGTPGSSLRRLEILQHQRQSCIQLQSVSGGVCEEESALSNKESSLDSSAASRLFSFCSRSNSFSISFVRLSLSFSRLSLSSTLICASTVGCQFNLANQRRHGGKEERNSDLLIDLELQESEEIDMAVGGEKSNQNDQQARCQGGPSRRIQRRVVSRSCLSGLCCEGHEINWVDRQAIYL